jgi:hypothetical protein
MPPAHPRSSTKEPPPPPPPPPPNPPLLVLLPPISSSSSSSSSASSSYTVVLSLRGKIPKQIVYKTKKNKKKTYKKVTIHKSKNAR